MRWIIVALLGIASSSFAQTIYEPVQFQYGTEDRKFYYGGTDPLTMRRGAFYGIRTINNEPLRVYTDLLPDVNATTYGFTIDDARNEAAANTPLHFSMKNANGAYRDGRAWIVPQRPVMEPARGTIMIKPYVKPVRREMQPVIVIPKSLLDKRLPTAPSA